MKKYLIFFLAFGATTLFSQQCFTDATLLATNGERGKAVSFIFSDDFSYGMDTVCGGGSECSIFQIGGQGHVLYYVYENSSTKFINTKDGIISYIPDGFTIFSVMQKNECSQDLVNDFNLKLKEYLKK